MIIPQELKDVITQLPSKEKDKLIFRLLKKDLKLANQLLFEFVSAETVESRREKTREYLKNLIDRATVHFYSTGYLNMDVRGMSGVITEHVSVTKDKYGEAALNLWMLNKVLEKNQRNILSESIGKSEKFCVSVIARAFKIMILIKKLHADYFIDFEDELVKLGNLIADNSHVMKRAIQNGLDVNWLIRAEIPENIEQIHKDLRARGYLK